MQRMIQLRFRSLRWQLATGIVVVVALLATVFLLGLSLITSRQHEQEMDRETRERLRTVINFTAPVLKRFDHFALAQWVDMLMLAPGITGVEVRSHDSWSLATRGEKTGLWLRQDIADHDGVVLGAVTVYLQEKSIWQRVGMTILLTMAAECVALPVLFGVVWYLLGAFLKDLRLLASRAEEIGHTADLRLPGRERRDEIGRLARLLEARSQVIREGQEEMRLLNKAVEQASESVVITDREGIIRYVNPAFCRVTGYTSEEALGQNPRILKSSRHDTAFYRTMWDTLAQGNAWYGRLVNRRKNGREYEEELSISPIRNDTGEVTHYVAVKRDVSAELILERRLRQAQRLEAVGTLAGGISHEFNNILTVIRGNLEMMLYSLTPDHPLYPQLQDMQHSAARAADLVRQLMLFSRRNGENVRPIRLDEVIQRQQTLLQAMVGEKVRLRLVLERSWPVALNEGLIEQMLANLVRNARDAMDGPGDIELRVANREFDSSTSENTSRHGRYVLLAVRDTGRGMSPEVMDQLFDPFFSTKDTAPGGGLGLAVVYGLVRQLDGWIEVESNEGQGSELRLYLPPVAESSSPDDTASVIADPRARALLEEEKEKV